MQPYLYNKSYNRKLLQLLSKSFVLKKKHVMKDKIITALIILAWIGLFGYLFYKDLLVVAILSLILLGMALAFTSPEDK